MSIAVLAFGLAACGRLRYEPAGQLDGGTAGTDGGRVERSAFSGCVRPPVAAGDPELPRASVDASPPEVAGTIVSVPSGGDLQAALDAASPGDVIELEPGATYVGNFTLPEKTGDGWVVVRSSDMAALPPYGERIDPSFADAMPALVAPDEGPLVSIGSGAHHYRLEGLVLQPAPGVDSAGLVVLGSGVETDASRQAHHLVIDRCIVRGDPDVGGRVGIELDAASTAIVGSWISDWKHESTVGEAIRGSNGPGPFLIANNRIEGSVVNVAFGGQPPAITGLVPSDIEICGNHILKPSAWNPDDPSFEGTAWRTAHLVDLSHVSRVLVSGNLVENAWNDFALDTRPGLWGDTATAVVEDVTIAYNVVRHAEDGADITLLDPDDVIRGLRFEHDLFYGLGDVGLMNGRLFLVEGLDTLVVRHVTALPAFYVANLAGDPMGGIAFSDNVFGPTEYGLTGDGTRQGAHTLETYAPDGTFVANIMVGGPESEYPSGNFFPEELADVGFVDVVRGAYRLSSDSSYAGTASDGGDPGADFDALGEAVLDPF